MIELLKGDCLELMKDIPDNSVDMILCDFPYGTTCNKWDTIIPFDALWMQYKRIRKSNAPILLFSQQPFTSLAVTSNIKEFRYEWIYEKTNGTGFLNAKKMPLKAHENILVFYKTLPTYNPQFTKGKPYCRGWKNLTSSNYGKGVFHFSASKDGKRFPRSVLKFSNVSSDSRKGFHPTQKPVALLEYLIKTYTNEGDMILDNCMGSGSTGVAAINTKRSFIGIEKEEEYYNIALKRISEAEEAMNNITSKECVCQ